MTVPSSFFHVIVYEFFVLVNVAVYTASPTTGTTSGDQPANLYVNSAVFAFTASSCAGTAPYSTVVVSMTVPSSFFHVIV